MEATDLTAERKLFTVGGQRFETVGMAAAGGAEAVARLEQVPKQVFQLIRQLGTTFQLSLSRQWM